MSLVSVLITMSIAAIISPMIMQLSLMPQLAAARSAKQEALSASALGMAIKGRKVTDLNQVVPTEGCEFLPADPGVGMAKCSMAFGSKTLTSTKAFEIGAQLKPAEFNLKVEEAEGIEL